MQSFQYRPALDGLRALAVLPVLFYHADLGLASGGFLGVDLFFVLSGYLITSLLVIEAHTTGSIFLRGFWLRRARRLLPALLATLLLVSCYAALLATPEELGRIRSDGLATLGYVANWWYIYGGQSYFDQFNVSPLRHTWSLGIEEQWYLLWPLLLAIAFRRGSDRLSRLALFSAMAALLSLILMAILFDPASDPSRVYYGTDTHAHGLLIGAATAFVLARRQTSSLPVSMINFLGVAGAAVFVILVAAADDGSPWMYRGGFGLVALASAGMITACTRPEANLLKASLSFAPLVYIGRISYGLYLFHWPIYVILIPDRVGFGGAPLTSLRIALSFALAIASFHLLEMPVRRRGAEGLRALAMAVSGIVAISLVLVAATWHSKNQSDESSFVQADPAQSAGKLRVSIVGDSVAGRIGEHFRSDWGPHLAVSTMGVRGCGIMTGELPIPGKPAYIQHCNQWELVFKIAVQDLRPELVLLSIGSWEERDRIVDGQLLEVGSTAWKRYFLGQLRKARAALSKWQAKVVIVTRPCSRMLRLPNHPALVRPGANEAVNDVLKHFAGRHSEIGLIDLAAEICKGGHFVPELDGVKLYSDGVHFTEAGSRRVWQFLTPEIEREWARLSSREEGPEIR